MYLQNAPHAFRPDANGTLQYTIFIHRGATGRGGADARVRAGPLDPLLAKRNQRVCAKQADEGVGRGPGVRPTTNAECAVLGGLSGIVQEYVRHGFQKELREVKESVIMPASIFESWIWPSVASRRRMR
jgi:hypothetical protein